jgi:hypothetical protein
VNEASGLFPLFISNHKLDISLALDTKSLSRCWSQALASHGLSRD